MINKYIIFERYEYWGRNGKEFTKWFKMPSSKFYDDENSAKEKIKQIRIDNTIDKVTKCKHEYEVRLIDCETLPIPEIKFNKKGRPSKKELEIQQFKQKNYWKLYFGLIELPK